MMSGHDVNHPASLHVRITLRKPEDLSALESMVAEIVRWNPAPDYKGVDSIDALLTDEQYAALQAAEFRVEVLARAWTSDELKKQVSQGNRYAERLQKLRTSKKKP